YGLCDPGELCQSCEAYPSCICRAAREFAESTLSQKRTRRRRIPLQFSDEAGTQEVNLTFSTAPFELDGETLAVVVVEELTKLRLVRVCAEEDGLHGMAGRHAKMHQLFETIIQVGRLDVPVVIEGESGTGKELVANALHRESARADRRLVPVNCGALAQGLLESELFGHVKGAFSGAVRDKKGRFELAHRGTIFLDEVGEITPPMQVRLLRVLQDGTFERVGSENTTKVDVRVVCATNRNLEQEVARGRFREDLYYRLCVIKITTPPLRERQSDIPLLADHLLDKASKDFNLERVALSPAALDCLMGHTWPGNVRELENTLRQGLIRAEGSAIEPEHLPLSLRTALPPTVERRRCRLSADRVAEALETAGGNKSEAARILGVGRATLYRYLSQHESATR
ncbi:MAG: sigma-54 dependent transcriptional regulator, partial [Thermoanaerobaculia bacterium]